MVPPSPPADDHIDPAWLTRIQNILRLSRGGVVVGLEGAHLACAGPLIEQLLEVGADVRVCFSGRELLAAPEGSSVVLLHAARDAELLNMVRPVIAERRLRVFVWLQAGDRRELSRRARDFLDWMQLTIAVPSFLPRYALTALHHALHDKASVLWDGPPLSALPLEATVLLPDADDDEALAAMQRGPVVIRKARGQGEVDRFEALHRAAGCGFGIIWEDPDVLPEHAERIIAEPLEWEVASTWLEDAGVDEPRIEAARLHLDPMAIAQRTGREPPPLRSAQPESPPSHTPGDRIIEGGPRALRVSFPSGPVTLTAELDTEGQLVLRYEGIPLPLFCDALEIVADAASLPVKLEIRDFDAGGHHWHITAHHGPFEWNREPGRCYFDWDETEGSVEVVVVASAETGSRSQARSFVLEITPTAPPSPH